MKQLCPLDITSQHLNHKRDDCLDDLNVRIPWSPIPFAYPLYTLQFTAQHV